MSIQNQQSPFQKPKKINKKKVIKYGAIIIVIIIIAVVLALVTKDSGDKGTVTQPGVQPSQPISQSVIYIPPVTTGRVFLEADNNSLAVGEKVKVAIKLDTKGYNINLAKVVLNFDADLLEFEMVDTADSVLTMDIREEQENGRLYISRGIPGDTDYQDSDDGFTGADGLFATAVFKALAPGSVPISIKPSETKIFLDDGYATEMNLELAGIKIEIK